MVFVGHPHHPDAAIQVREGRVRVVLFDTDLREWVTCLFEASGEEKVFMTTATVQTFRGQSDAFELRKCHHAREDGSLVTEREYFQTGRAEPTESTMDVSRLWALYSAFGQYELFFGLYWPGK